MPLYCNCCEGGHPCFAQKVMKQTHWCFNSTIAFHIWTKFKCGMQTFHTFAFQILVYQDRHSVHSDKVLSGPGFQDLFIPWLTHTCMHYMYVVYIYINIQTYVNLFTCVQFLSHNIHVQVTPLACSTLYVHHPYNHGPAPSWGPVLTKTPPWVWGQCKYVLVGQDLNPCRIGVVCWTNFGKGA